MKNFFVYFIFFGLLCTTINAQVIDTRGNVGIGLNVLGNTATTIRNVAVGDSALNKNSYSRSNNAFGYKTLDVNTVGYFNTAIGSFSMHSNIGGESNTAIGHKSLYQNNNGKNNVALGYESLYSNVSGNYNTSVGTKSLQKNVSSNNNAFGNEALQYSTGFANNAFGAKALFSLTTGDENIAFGYLAGENISSGYRNVAIGSYSGTEGPSSNNISIGWKSGGQSTANFPSNNNICIGKGVMLPQNTNNSMNIGGVLFGSGFKADESQWYGAYNGRIGINVIVPTATLDVAGDAKISSTLNVTGHVGIGSASTDPTGAMLTVKGKIHTTEVIVDVNAPLADYVFSSNYNLMPLNQVEQYVKSNSHLPEIPSATEANQKGINVGEMQNKLLQKIEELTLYMIEQQKQIEELKKQLGK